MPYLHGIHGNPSSTHSLGRQARQALTAARRSMAGILGVDRDDVVFTGNGSEANVLAVAGTVAALPSDRRQVLTTTIEHASVRDTLRGLAARGHLELVELPVGRSGRLDLDSFHAALGDRTGLVSIMGANNEIGTLQPVREVGEALRDHPAVFHIDAAQMVGKIAVDCRALWADLLTFSSHKFGGPRGVGVLVRCRPTALASPFSAGRQESGLRGGTEDVASAVGTAAALQEAVERMDEEQGHVAALAGMLREQLGHAFPDVVLHSPATQVLVGTVNFSLPGRKGAWLVAALDAAGIAVSHGSACSALAPLPSHVIQALGCEELADSSLRISLGRESRSEHVDKLVAELRRVVGEMAKKKISHSF